MRTCPQFEIRNEEAGKVTLKLQSSDPSISAVIEGVFTGQIADAEEALKDLDARRTEEMEQAFEAAAADGADVDISELQFPNWDPSSDYTAEQYEELQS